MVKSLEFATIRMQVCVSGTATRCKNLEGRTIARMLETSVFKFLVRISVCELKLREREDFSLWEKPEGAGLDLVDYALMVHQVLARKIRQMILEDYQTYGDARLNELAANKCECFGVCDPGLGPHVQHQQRLWGLEALEVSCLHGVFRHIGKKSSDNLAFMAQLKNPFFLPFFLKRSGRRRNVFFCARTLPLLPPHWRSFVGTWGLHPGRGSSGEGGSSPSFEPKFESQWEWGWRVCSLPIFLGSSLCGIPVTPAVPYPLTRACRMSSGPWD
ncbi:hypothetical protein NC653_005703 [Populus alba x Populus x berolinensis]|uniref:Uncharacterized protein n=1 Tax=Populus alba x Populus x berolinensis TaxID=444605 RepID=A0AAD6RCH7_9ROSI|nr:hypothetical protein NC653_005703 [Populus alba x Populus x berolinensis]